MTYDSLHNRFIFSLKRKKENKNRKKTKEKKMKKFLERMEVNYRN